MKRWKKLAVILLSTAMTVSLCPQPFITACATQIEEPEAEGAPAVWRFMSQNIGGGQNDPILPTPYRRRSEFSFWQMASRYRDRSAA
ncbi:hypothetical protein EI53_00137 [Fusobacterium naviforme]|nr:hypothetical protein F7P78_00715 [Fusobacterium naviforme]PSL11111.1 hypothetical protein EI53_00137 [Fusobacterium naviforme]STO28486.1 Uncharacterised protein [Fusobacterium naviforme]